MARSNQRIAADLALLGVVFMWGATFVPVKVAVANFSVLGFIGLRFFFALLTLAPLALRRLRHSRLSGRQVWQGMITGVIFLAGYAFQTFGLRYTGSGRAAFITGLSTIMVPLILVWLFRERIRPRPVIGALLATAGMCILGFEGAAQGSLGGDLLVLGGAVSFAFHVILTGRWGSKCDPVLFTLLQVAVIVPLALLSAVVWEQPVPQLQPGVLVSALLIGVVVSGVGLLVQVWAQRITSPTHTAVIFATEPVFGALFGWLLAGEILTQAGFGGSALILLGMLVAESG